MARNGLSLLILCGLVISLGCSSEKKATHPTGETKPADKTADTSTESGPRVLTQAEQKLAGVWLGAAVLKEDLVEAEFEAKADDEARLAFVNEAEAFLSTIVAIHFKRDGTFEQDIELAATGARQTGSGTWRVTGQQDSKLIVQLTELDAEGNEIQAENLYQFYPDGNRFAMPAPVVDSLTKCSPLLVFSRQDDFVDDRTAETTGEDVTR